MSNGRPDSSSTADELDARSVTTGAGAHSLFSLDGRAAIVTGALGLLGKNHCRALASAGADVFVTDLSARDCEDYADSLRSEVELSRDQRIVGYPADITDQGSLRDLRDEVLRRTGRIDVLVNNAAIDDVFDGVRDDDTLGRFEEFPVELFRRSMDVNVTGTFLCSQVIGSVMAKAGSGSIINVASTYGMVGPDQSIYRRPDGSQSFYKSPAYPASKGALIALTRFLATYWGAVNVRVNALSPGGVENSQETFFVDNYSARTPLKRMAQPSDYQGAVVFLASDASSYMTGANLVVDGGWTSW